MTPPEIRRKKPQIDARIERQIVIGMIVSDRFIREIRPLCSSDGFQADFARRVAQWCLDYHEKYGKPPEKHIEDLYLQYKAEVPEEEAALLEEFLSGISEEYERAGSFNDRYVLDEAEQHFRLTSLKNLEDKLKKSIVGGRPDEGEELVKGYKRPARLRSQGIDPLRDVSSIVSALTPEVNNPDVILRLPGDLGEAVGPLERGFFIAIQAESGIGKTWWLWWFSQLCVFAGYDTVFFSLEMFRLKMVCRMWQWIVGAPSLEVPSWQLSHDGQLLVPVFDCEKNQTNECREECNVALLNGDKSKVLPLFRDAPRGYRPCSRCRGKQEFDISAWWKVAGKRDLLSPESALSKYAVLDRSGVMKKAGKFHLVEFPSGRHTMDDLRTYLNNLEYYEGFVPSVIVTDYADKIKWSVKGDPRVSIWQIWDGHKSLAQEKYCLVATASQSNTERSGKKVGQGTWGETQEKRHLLDLGIDLNQSASDQSSGMIRVTVDKNRHGQMERAAEIAVLQQLAIGRPYIDSCRLVRKGKE